MLHVCRCDTEDRFSGKITQFLSSSKLVDALLALRVNKTSFMSAAESLFRLLTSKIKIIGEYMYSQVVICHLSWFVHECPERTGTMLGVVRAFVVCCTLIQHLPDCSFLYYLKKVSSKGEKTTRKSILVWVASFEGESNSGGTEG